MSESLNVNDTFTFDGVFYSIINIVYIDNEPYCYLEDEYGHGDWVYEGSIKEFFTEEKEMK